MVSAADPLWSLISVFVTRAANFLSSSSSFILTRAQWTPLQTHCYSENLVVLGIGPGTFGLAARNSDHQTTEAVHFEINNNKNTLWNIRAYSIEACSKDTCCQACRICSVI
jgi:hypothetical protein